jgi:hypothetical protein
VSEAVFLDTMFHDCLSRVFFCSPICSFIVKPLVPSLIYCLWLASSVVSRCSMNGDAIGYVCA